MAESSDMGATPKPERTNATFRIDLGALDRLAAIAARMSERAGGVEVSRNSAFRTVLDRGLDDLERELGIKRRK